MSKYSIVLVIRPYSHHKGSEYNNIDRFLGIGMVSYEQFLKMDDVRDFFVVVPAAEVDSVKTLLASTHPSVPWRVLNEESLVNPSIPPGWARQQTAKLAIAALVQTDAYLIIDDDTYLTKPFGAHDLCDPNTGKYIMNRTQIDFPFFYLWSCQVLQFDFDQVQYAPCHMAITPEIFVTHVVRDIIKFLVDKYGDDQKWQRHLADHKYTEYCLYWIWLLMHQQSDALYATESTALSLYDNVTIVEDQDIRDSVRASFENNERYWFSFVQSSLPIPVSVIEKEVLRYLRKK